MTNEKAKEWLECLVQGCNDDRVIGALQKGINALEKQIPKKPKGRYDYHGKYIVGNITRCPVCDSVVAQNLSNEKVDYCIRCDQAIDWSDT